MSIDNEPAVLVARFLRSNGYFHTLNAYLDEANLPSDAGASSKPGCLSIEQIVQEKKAFDLALDFEKLNSQNEDASWSLPAPTVPTEVDVPARANVLQTSIDRLSLSPEAEPEYFIIASLANRQLNILTTDAKPRALRTLTNMQDSPILSFLVMEERYIMSTSMSGRLVLYDIWSDIEVDSRKDHSKYAVKITSYQVTKQKYLVATAGWDGRVFVYQVAFADNELPRLDGPVAAGTVASNPEHVGFIADPSSERLFLALSRRDSTVLSYYGISISTLSSTHAQALWPEELELVGTQNINSAYANSWVAFTPSAFTPCPTDPLLMAAVTSAVPHMKLIIFRLLLPPKADLSVVEPRRSHDSDSRVPVLQREIDAADTLPGATYAREVEAQRAREADAIKIHCNTMAPQTAYSTPTLAWRPDGTGIWVNSDDGIVRGIETESGKTVARLKAHEPASKLRCLWAGSVKTEQGMSEWLVSGGFDQRLIVWRDNIEAEESRV